MIRYGSSTGNYSKHAPSVQKNLWLFSVRPVHFLIYKDGAWLRRRNSKCLRFRMAKKMKLWDHQWTSRTLFLDRGMSYYRRLLRNAVLQLPSYWPPIVRKLLSLVFTWLPIGLWIFALTVSNVVSRLTLKLKGWIELCRSRANSAEITQQHSRSDTWYSSLSGSSSPSL